MCEKCFGSRPASVAVRRAGNPELGRDEAGMRHVQEICDPTNQVFLVLMHRQVGVCHALSYGLSFVLGTPHGVGNCIVFDQLEEYYPAEVAEFRRMVERNGIELPRGLTRNLTEEQFSEMIRVALSLAPLWENALGKEWQKHMTAERARALYNRM